MPVVMLELGGIRRHTVTADDVAASDFCEDSDSQDLDTTSNRSALGSSLNLERQVVVREREDRSQEHMKSGTTYSGDGLDEISRMKLGSGEYGCAHYRRRCRIRSPCCGKLFDCRHCHNDAMNSDDTDPSKRHDLPRHLVESVVCTLCRHEQKVSQFCSKCGVCMGEYFCNKCKFYDDDTSKNQFHCDSCGICRVGGRDKFFHCDKCGCCYSIELKKKHSCVENAMHHNCPVCFDYLFDSVKQITVMPCGHTMHADCLKDMYRHSKYSCPMCSKSVCDMSKVWDKLDQEVAATPMPDIYRNKLVWILCNDCGTSSEVFFHIVAHKCLTCGSYNTRQTTAVSSNSSSN